MVRNMVTVAAETAVTCGRCGLGLYYAPVAMDSFVCYACSHEVSADDFADGLWEDEELGSIGNVLHVVSCRP